MAYQSIISNVLSLTIKKEILNCILYQSILLIDIFTYYIMNVWSQSSFTSCNWILRRNVKLSQTFEGLTWFSIFILDRVTLQRTEMSMEILRLKIRNIKCLKSRVPEDSDEKKMLNKILHYSPFSFLPSRKHCLHDL